MQGDIIWGLTYANFIALQCTYLSKQSAIPLITNESKVVKTFSINVETTGSREWAGPSGEATTAHIVCAAPMILPSFRW